MYNIKTILDIAFLSIDNLFQLLLKSIFRDQDENVVINLNNNFIIYAFPTIPSDEEILLVYYAKYIDKNGLIHAEAEEFQYADQEKSFKITDLDLNEVHLLTNELKSNNFELINIDDL